MKVLPNPPGGGDVDETHLAHEARPSQPSPVTPASPTARSPSDPARTSGWCTPSGIDHGRFPPGTILGDRYRIVGKLGKGGMGEVFRADDLKLGQQVALKFLPTDVDRDPVRLTQLHTEVRMARQVSHPNVCRVYDIDEVEGHTFLSMEYVDGEDLASLLRRIGRFNEERGLEIARQVCAGLAAAHERDVIHRDFKPANVMIDAAGHVRITDFGLAGASGESIRAGTPAYMAPEQIAGADVTARSDIYALGLVLYELFTGKRAIEAGNLAELIRRREQAEIVPPSALASNLSPEIDRAIMRCLAPDPQARPASALSVSASLPGGDPLAAALAAGETPSPEMVAAAGEEGALRKPVGIALLAFVLIGLLLIPLAAGRTSLVNRASFTKSADVLAERAREIISLAGIREAPADSAHGVATNREYLDWVAANRAVATRWASIGDGSAPLLDFWYRTSPVTLRPLGISWSPSWNDPPPDLSGMVTVVLDDRGRLLEFLRVPPQRDTTDVTTASFDWNPLFQAAGLDPGAFVAAAPEWTPRVYADARLAWQGQMPKQPDVPIRVEAASYRGFPVSFKVVGPWSTASRMVLPQPTTTQRVLAVIGSLVILLLLAGAVLLVRANLKSGRADRRGAGRVALFLLIVWMAAWVLGGRHSFVVNEESTRFFIALALALLNVGATWLFYLALEPFVRRLLPDLLIGWTRLLVGHLRDPRVGRDLLIGVATGVLFLVVASADTLALMVTGRPVERVEPSNMAYFVGARFAIANMLTVLPNALQSAMIGSFLYVVLLAIVRRQWIAATLVLLLICALVLSDSRAEFRWLTIALGLLVGVITLAVFLRFGLLALATALLVLQILSVAPLTLDPTQPHAGISTLALMLIAAVAGWAFHVSRAGHGMFRRLLSSV